MPLLEAGLLQTCILGSKAESALVLCLVILLCRPLGGEVIQPFCSSSAPTQFSLKVVGDFLGLRGEGISQLVFPVGS